MKADFSSPFPFIIPVPVKNRLEKELAAEKRPEQTPPRETVPVKKRRSAVPWFIVIGLMALSFSAGMQYGRSMTVSSTKQQTESMREPAVLIKEPTAAPTKVPTAAPTPVPTEAPADTAGDQIPSSALQGTATDDVVIRSGPGFSYDEIGSVSAGRTVRILSGSTSDWYHVSVDGITGYIRSAWIDAENISLENDSPVNLQDGSSVTGYATENVVIRSGPGFSYDEIGSVSLGEKVLIYDDSTSDWYHVNADGTVGYVRSAWILLP